MKSDVIIYTDGACKGNPGVGGWGAILEYKDINKKIYGYDENTTNNWIEKNDIKTNVINPNFNCCYCLKAYSSKTITPPLAILLYKFFN